MKMLNTGRLKRLAQATLLPCVLVSAPRMMSGQARTIHGVVLRADSHVPLAFSIISVLGTSVERFADDSGRFVIADLPRDSATLRIRHIGYAPVEVPVSGDSVRVELHPIAVSLATVQIEADRRCIVPSRPDPKATDPASVIINQLIENGRQYELLTTKYPFVAQMHQSYGYLSADSTAEHASERLEPIVSDRVWKYRPGQVIDIGPHGRQVNVPTIAVFAQDEFLRRHCFWVDAPTDSMSTLKIEFHPSELLSDPDLRGTIYLDPKSFTIQRSVLQITKLAKFSDEFDSVTLETGFTEIYPGVPIITAIDGFDAYSKPHVSDGKTRLAFLERQRTVSLEFANGPPGADAKKKGPRTRLLLDRIIGVYSEATGQPIKDAVVFDTLSQQQVKTSGTGTTRLAFVLNDHAVLKISAPGFEPLLMPVELSLKSLPPLTLTLRPTP